MQKNSGLNSSNLLKSDLSSSEQMEEFRQLYDQAPCGYHSLDENGVFVRINQTELDMLGYSRSEIIGKKKVFDMLTSASQQMFLTNFPLFKRQGWVKDLEYQMICKDSSILPVSISSTAIYDQAGHYVMSRSIMIDISDRVRLQADRQQVAVALKEAHQSIITNWESMTDAYVSLDFDWRYTYVNQAAINVITYLANIEPTAILGKTHWEVFPLLDDGKLQAKYQQAIDEQIPAHFELLYDATGNWFELHVYPSALGLGIYFRDITARKESEAKLLCTEARLRYLLSSNPAILYACQASGDYAATFISENITAMLGYQSQEFLDDNMFWSDRIHPEDAPQVFAGLNNLFSESVLTHEYRFLHQDGTYRWVLDELKLIRDSEGNPLEIVGYWIDITERKQAEQKIREQANLLAIATDAIFVYDLDHRVLFWNQGAENLYGWTAAEIIGQDWRQLLDQDKWLETTNDLQTIMQVGAWQGELPKITQVGKDVLVMSRCSLMLDDAGQPKSILVVDTDITEKKQLESQFLRAQRLESLGMLAGGIAHDLNNVLTPIIGIAQLLPIKLPHLDDKTQRLLKIIDNSAHRGADLVKQILSFTRGIEGKPTNTQVSHLLAEIQKIIRQTFPKNIEFLIDLPSDLCLIPADATMLHQVFMNLCVNARDAMPHGGVLSITAENIVIDNNYARMNLDAQEGSYVLVTVSDTGVGIPPEIVDRIFDPFFTTKEIGKGTGLGLSTVIGIVNSHHGFLNVYSEVGKGTRFKIHLPATDAIEQEVSEKPIPLGNGELILVVDDEVAVQEITQATLETHGYKTITANDGIEAIALYAEHKQNISVVLLDLMMPSLDSVTIIRTLSKLNSQVQVIAMSGLSTNESITRMNNEGVKSFLAKPFTAPELLNLLAPLCRNNPIVTE
jgi:PAS domain S-box-containing protein